MTVEPIKILIADDKQDICETLKETLIIEMDKYNLELGVDYVINIVFTEHAFDHGCAEIRKGFYPDICIFDLIFNGYTGLDLYNYIIANLANKPIDLCIYTGVEKAYEKRNDAEVLSSQMQGLITIISKPNVDEILSWINKILTTKYKKEKQVEESDPFDLL